MIKCTKTILVAISYLYVSLHKMKAVLQMGNPQHTAFGDLVLLEDV